MSREDMTVLLGRALKPSQPVAALDFRDAAATEPWARQSLAEAVAAGAITGCPAGTFQPLAAATHSQAARVLAAVLAQVAAGTVAAGG